MIGFLQSLLAFIGAIAVLITFHEFGHYWVARRCGVKILRFSVGFGRPLWKREVGPDRTEFVVAALPLGGYVKMLDEREGTVAPEERARAFNNKGLWTRFIIVLAGPLFNFIFAIGAYWAMFFIGVDGLRPIVGDVEVPSLAAQAGIEAGDELVQVGDRPTPTWTAFVDVAVPGVIKGRTIDILVRRASGDERRTEIDLSQISVDDMAGGQLLAELGMTPKRPVIPPIIGALTDGGAAERGGLRPGDKIVATDGRSISGWSEWVEIVRANAGEELSVEIVRGTESLTLTIVPERFEDGNGNAFGRIGAAVDAPEKLDSTWVARERYGVLPALWKGIAKTGEMSVITLQILGKMISGEASVKNLSGPISIAQYAGTSAGLGITAFLAFLAIVSVSLGVLNLLPIPLLDGGHLMYYLIELAKGSPVSEATQAIGQQFGLAILLGLMGLAFYNDILRLVG